MIVLHNGIIEEVAGQGYLNVMIRYPGNGAIRVLWSGVGSVRQCIDWTQPILRDCVWIEDVRHPAHMRKELNAK